jgi:fused signal recognition particle receptor
MSEQGQKKGFWGTTLNKLKSVLANTRDEVHDPADSASETQVAESQATQTQAAEHTVEQDSVQTQVESQTQGETQVKPAEQTQVTSATEVIAAPRPQAPAYPAAKPSAPRPVDEDFIESLEERLIKADIGLVTVDPIIQQLKKESRGKNWTSHDVDLFLQREFAKVLDLTSKATLSYKPGVANIYLIVGVNGVGKTTSIGKLANRFKSEGKKVLLAAGDTFRAAAESQLEIWSQRAGVDIVRLADGADPGAVVFQAIARAKQENYDVVLVDTAGRLHNKTNLMAELKKVRTVVEKNAVGMNVESLLVLDASTGQNGLQQAKVFSDVCGLTGVILTKLDGTAKGGVVFAIAKELKIPVKMVGLGEKMEDLRDFEPAMFVQALFS